ncbi:MAG: hypothetical protein Q8P41_31905 [Pseudomonadota bacterium]|nr:hypothetical protein [Pseudomonadota bacterium]
MLTKLVSERRVLGRGPRGYGKSAEFALAVCWFATTREGAEVAWKIVTTAGGWSQLRDYLWPEIHLWVGRIRWDVLGMQPWRQDRELLRLEIRLRHGSAMAANPKVSAKIEGGHAEQFLYVFDEAKLIPSTTWDSAEGSAASATGDRELRWLAQSSGGEADGRFFEIASGKVRGWWPRHVTKDEAIAAGRMNEAWADEMLDLWGENSPPYQNHVLGNFAATGGANTVIRLSDVERAFERWREWDRNGRPGEDDQAALGVDVGSGNLDRDPATIARRCGDGGNVVSSVDVLRFSDKYPEMELAGQVRARLGAGGHAVIDAIGQGAGVISRLLEAPQMDARAFIAGGGSVEKDASGLYGFVNQRAEAWWKFREALADPDSEIALPPDPILLGELVAPSWKTVSIGKILVESKDEIAKRLAKLESRKALNEGGSTNRADAVIQSFVGNAAVELAPGATRLGYSEMGDIEECRW